MNWEALEERLNKTAVTVFGKPQVFLDGVEVEASFSEPIGEVPLGSLGAYVPIPRLELLASAVPANHLGKSVMVGTKEYTVAESKSDGFGMTTLFLEKA